MSNFECLGLPAVGKSWVVNNALCPSTHKCVPVSSFHKSLKVWYGLVGIIFYFRLVPKAYAIYRYSDSLSVKISLVKFLILFSRLGVLKTSKSIVIDEGPLQALWGTIWRIDYNPESKILITQIVNFIIKGQTILYVTARKVDYENRVSSRSRKHPFNLAAARGSVSGRAWLSHILKTAKSNTSVLLLKN
jgi:hypothetical protein